MAEKVSAYLL